MSFFRNILMMTGLAGLILWLTPAAVPMAPEATGAAAGVTNEATDASFQPESYYPEICRRVAVKLPRLHLLHEEMDDAVSARAWTNLVTSFDFERLYFLQSDIETFNARQTLMDDDVLNGDMAFAIEVFDVFKQRLSNRVAYTQTLLDHGFDWTQNESYVWMRKDAPWPADETEWNDLWRRKIKNEYLRIVIGREMDAAETNDAPASAAPADATNRAGVAETLIEVEFPTNGTAAATGATVEVTAAITNAPETAATNIAATVAPPELAPEDIIRKRYQQVMTVIQDSDPEYVLQRYLNAFAQAYDPHSLYYPPSALEDFEIEMRLSLGGIGALLSAEDGAAKVVRLIPGGPAARDTRERRLQPGDKIIAVGQDEAEAVDILHWPLHRIVALIRGEKGTRVVLTVIPATDPGGGKLKTVDLTRDVVKLEDQAATGTVHSVTAELGGEVNVGVIRLPSFYGDVKSDAPDARTSVSDVRRLIEAEMAKGAQGILLDLRGNGGGFLTEAIDMIGLFIRRGPTVQVKERFGTRTLSDEDPRIAYRGPLVVLVNRLSASASEIVAGALQDYGRAVIVGDSKTHGKGTVQSVLDLGSDERFGALKVTSSCYYRISGASTQRDGITPDIVVPSPWDFMETGENFLPNAMPGSQERPARFRPVADLEAVIPQLRERSEQRRRTSERFQTYARLLERIAEMNESHEVPLNIEARRRFAQTERELSDIQERLTAETELDAEPAAEEQADDNADLVLNEGLHILADLVTLQPTMAFDEPPEFLLPRSFADWLKAY